MTPALRNLVLCVAKLAAIFEQQARAAKLCEGTIVGRLR